MAGTKRILLVDDEPSTTELLSRLLRSRGYEVAIAPTAAEALAAARSDSFDLIITDIRLPDRLGTDLMRDIAAHQKVPGIALSGISPDDLKAEDGSLFAAYLVKPISLDKLLLAVSQTLGRSSS